MTYELRENITVLEIQPFVIISISRKLTVDSSTSSTLNVSKGKSTTAIIPHVFGN